MDYIIIAMNNNVSELIQFSRRKPFQENLSKLKKIHAKSPYSSNLGKISRSGSGSQRVTVKISYAHPKKLSAHIAYIQREGAGEDGKKPELFSDKTEQSIDKIDDEKRFFKVIISPENANQLQDMKEYTKQVMKEVGQTMNTELRWNAVVHKNTDNPHAHVVIRGVDKKGQEVKLDPRLISQGFRDIAQKVATKELGQRREKDVLNRQESEKQKKAELSLGHGNHKANFRGDSLPEKQKERGFSR